MPDRRVPVTNKAIRMLWILGLAAGVLAGGVVAFGLAVTTLPPAAKL